MAKFRVQVGPDFYEIEADEFIVGELFVLFTKDGGATVPAAFKTDLVKLISKDDAIQKA